MASYLVETAEGITLIDAGLPGHWHDLQRELAEIGRPLSDVRGLILTHGDSDHIGFAERLRRETGCPVHVHAADAQRAMTGVKPKTAIGPMRLVPTMRFLGYGIRKGMRPRHVGAVVEIADGDVLALPGSPAIIGMPGHSPGSVAVHVPTADALFVGDALTTRHVLTGREGAAPAPFTDEPAQADASLDAIGGIAATWVLPGHGAPWRGSPADLVAQVRAA